MADGINSNGETCILHGLELSIFTQQNPDLNNTGLLFCISGLADVRKVRKGTSQAPSISQQRNTSLLLLAADQFITRISLFSEMRACLVASPELKVLHNQITVRVLFPEQLAKRTTKIRFTAFTVTISCTASFIFVCPQSSHGLTCEQQHPSWPCQVLWYSQCHIVFDPTVRIMYQQMSQVSTSQNVILFVGLSECSSLLRLYPGFLLYKLINDVLKSSGETSV